MAGVMEAFLAARQQAAQQQNQQLGMLAQLVQLQGASADREMRAKEHQIRVEEARRKNELTGGLVGLLQGPNAENPEVLRRIGLTLGATGHPGGAAFVNAAEKAQQLRENQAAVRAMQSGPERARMLDPQELQQEADYGNPAQSPTMPGTPGVFGPLLSSPYVAPAAQAAQAQIDKGGAGFTPQFVQSQFDRLMQMHNAGQTTADNRAARQDAQQQAERERIARQQEAIRAQQDNIRLAASLRQPPQPAAPTLVYRKEPDGSTTAIDFRTGKEMKGVTPAGGVTADIRHDNSAATQFARGFQGAAREPMKNMQAVEAYRNFREVGDNAQSVTLAAEAVRQAARTGTQRFKGEADRILGRGYGGGPLTERIENYFRTQFTTGTPPESVMKNLDQLVDAAEDAALGQVANQARFYAAQAKGRALPLQHVTGAPLVFRNKVVLPDGRFAVMPTAEKAQELANQWLTENP